VNVETKDQPKQWMHTHSTKRATKFKQTLSARKPKTAIFWNKKPVLLVELMQQGTTIMSQVYCETHKNCVGPAVQNEGVEW
jgi:hypothetical protein